MAQLSPTRFRATDANNVVVSGAGLFVYQTGTTTKQTLYSDADLTITRANPVVSVSTGYWPQFYVAAGATLDIQARTTDDVGSALLWEALEVDSVGNEDTGTFSRDFGANGRMQAVGASGAVRFEFGPPTGDNIGGSMVVSGWAGTDLDAAEWRGPLNVTGPLTADVTAGAGSNVMTLLSSGNATGSAGIALSPDYSAYRLEISYITLSALCTIEAFFAFDGTPTYKVGADDYSWLINWNGIAGATTANAAMDISDARLALMNVEAAIAAANPGRATIEITSSALLETGIAGTIWLPNDDGSYSARHGNFSGQTRGKTYGKATYFKIAPSAGTLAYRYALFGIPGLGV